MSNDHLDFQDMSNGARKFDPQDLVDVAASRKECALVKDPSVLRRRDG